MRIFENMILKKFISQKKHISKFSNKTFEYLRENEFLRETILTCLSGAQTGWINAITKMLKTLVTLPI